MSKPIETVAIAGATGNIGPTLATTLQSAGFKIKALTRESSKAIEKLSPNVAITEVAYDSKASLVTALRGIQAVVVCGVGMLPEQTNLIDAAIDAGVAMFIPADFAGDLTNPLCRTLPVNASKVATESYLKEHEHEISHASIRNGPLLDWGIAKGNLINMKDRSIRLFDGGDTPFSATTIPTVCLAVARVLSMGEAARNRVFSIHDAVLTQNKLLDMAKELTPGEEWEITPASTAAIAKMSEEGLKKDPNNRMAMQAQKAIAIFGQGYSGAFAETDNAELGIATMDRAEIKKILKVCS